MSDDDKFKTIQALVDEAKQIRARVAETRTSAGVLASDKPAPAPDPVVALVADSTAWVHQELAPARPFPAGACMFFLGAILGGWTTFQVLTSSTDLSTARSPR